MLLPFQTRRRKIVWESHSDREERKIKYLSVKQDSVICDIRAL